MECRNGFMWTDDSDGELGPVDRLWVAMGWVSDAIFMTLQEQWMDIALLDEPFKPNVELMRHIASMTPATIREMDQTSADDHGRDGANPSAGTK